MWLLNVHTKKLESFEGSGIQKYAILSHRWQDEEVTFKEVQKSRCAGKKGWLKVEKCCDLAQRHGIDYVWADTCCIDKRSSAELSEAINSMFQWYEQSEACLAYLVDVDVATIGQGEGRHWDIAELVKKSKWFTRGWTLQELLAPKDVLLYDTNWTLLGSKEKLAWTIEACTGIPPNVIEKFNRSDHSIAERMTWAANRQTTQLEDESYCLFGLFDINLPLLYGEGSKAFVRLQEELIRTSEDASVFVWPGQPSAQSSLLAASPGSYIHPRMQTLKSWQDSTLQDYSFSKNGLSGLGILRPHRLDVYCLAIGCNYAGHVVAMFVVRKRDEGYVRVLLDDNVLGYFPEAAFGITRQGGPLYTMNKEGLADREPIVISHGSGHCYMERRNSTWLRRKLNWENTLVFPALLTSSKEDVKTSLPEFSIDTKILLWTGTKLAALCFVILFASSDHTSLFASSDYTDRGRTRARGLVVWFAPDCNFQPTIWTADLDDHRVSLTSDGCNVLDALESCEPGLLDLLTGTHIKAQNYANDSERLFRALTTRLQAKDVIAFSTEFGTVTMGLKYALMLRRTLSTVRAPAHYAVTNIWLGDVMSVIYRKVPEGWQAYIDFKGCSTGDSFFPETWMLPNSDR